MTMIEIILLLVGCVFMIGSFFISEKLSSSELNKIAELSEDELKNNVTVSAVKDTEIIKITVTTKEPVNSAKIANEIAEVFTAKVKEIYSIENVQVVDKAEISYTPSNINHKKDCYFLVNMLNHHVSSGPSQTSYRIDHGYSLAFDTGSDQFQIRLRHG